MTLVVAYAVRYEPQWMVDQLLENVSWADQVVELDDRDRTEDLWRPRPERVALCRQLALDAGGDWCLILDPDERLEDNAEGPIREAIAGDPTTSWSLPMRELFTPTQWRVDGPWRNRWRRRLFHLHEPRERRRHLRGAAIYHLKMIEPENRVMRARVHGAVNTWDNRNRGFTYLADDDGMRLRSIEPGRGYSPPYRPYLFDPGAPFADNPEET